MSKRVSSHSSHSSHTTRSGGHSSQHHSASSIHGSHNALSPDSLQQIVPEPITLEEIENSFTLTPLASSSSSPQDSDPSAPAEEQLKKRVPFESQQQFPTLRKIIHYLDKVQKYTGYAFTTFVGIHISSVIIAPGLGVSLQKSQDLFELGRAIYQQTPGMEFLLVTGCSIAHIASGIGKRLLRNHIRHQNRVVKPKVSSKLLHDTPILTESERDDIGLGGITGLIGLGYRKSWISRLTPELTPLTFSGYVLIPLLLYHYIKFRHSPVSVDGDSSLVTLQYITHMINFDELFPRYQKVVNYFGFLLLVWVGSYHMVSGLWKIRRRFGARDKKLGYIIINGLTLLSAISLFRFWRTPLDTGFLGKSFGKYIRYILW